jgi:beta-alanine degradation protein BauB
LVVCEGRTAEDGCATLNPMRTILAIGFLSCGLLLAQDKSLEVVPIDKEPSHHLVFENEYVRVFSVEVAPHAETKYHQHDRDYVWVSLGDSDVESVRVGGAAVALQPKDGETQFTKGGFAHKAVNKSDKPFRNVTVEIKKAGLGDVGKKPCDCVAPQGQGCGCGGIAGWGADGIDWSHGTSFGAIKISQYGIAPLSAVYPGRHGDRESLIEKVPALFIAQTALQLKSSNTTEEIEAGAVRWLRSGSAHAAVNRGEPRLRFTLIEVPPVLTKDPPQGPSRQKQGARDDKAKSAADKTSLSKDKF